ncbi:ABC transporter substrate-binding protein [Bernardetia sp. OM2101]|uniref:ABC transporter substrate-binding protein n=1 Tax=Bernardetia sp. OM2101 TaxID=3344876 RepID=UPI0035D09EF5
MPIYTDQLNRKIDVKEFPKRIISLVPSQTELLFDLGVGQNVVGVTKYCIHPKEKIKKITKVGGTKDFDINKIIELNPDLIIANKEENYKEGIEELESKFSVWISDITDLSSSLEMILEVGKLVQKQKEAKSFVYKLNQDFQELKTLTTENHKTLYFIWKNPFMVAGKDTFIDDILQRTNLENSTDEKRYPIIDAEKIKKLNPQIILLSSEPYPFKEKHIQEFARLLPNAYIRVVDGELFSWYGSRLKYTTDYLKELQKDIKLHFNKI